jgi:hypothetical protein
VNAIAHGGSVLARHPPLFNAISPCLEGNIDTRDVDVNNPGTQLECSVSDVQNAGTPMRTETQIPVCPMSNPTTPAANGPRPCYWIDQNTTACPAPDTGYELNLVRNQPPAVGTEVDVECAIAPM